jgi:hypothetical protein
MRYSDFCKAKEVESEARSQEFDLEEAMAADINASQEQDHAATLFLCA